jgi:hypothetical protein
MRCQLPANILVKFTATGQDIQAPDDLPDALFPPEVFHFLLSEVALADKAAGATKI